MPRFLRLTKEGHDGTRRFAEGSLAYTAIAMCNNWELGLSDGYCPIKPADTDEAKI